MSEQVVKDNAAKARIVNHLNEDHHDSLVRYLEHYRKLPSWQAYDGRISGVDLNGMTLVCRGKNHRIPFNPPMTSYREARERAVQMDKESLEGLGRSDITINEFSPPIGLKWAVPALTICTVFIVYGQRWWFAKGQVVEQLLGSGFARFSFVIQPYLITFMLFMHSWESVYFAYSRLIKHSVNPRTLVFWQWCVTAWIEGFNAFFRFDELVKGKREAKAKQQH